MEKQNRKRDIQLLFRVTPEEKRLIQEKMRLVDMTNMRAYMREMMIKGYIINTDISDIKNLAAELQRIDVNIRQILKHVDKMGAAYAADAEEIRQKLGECWNFQRQLFKEALPVKHWDAGAAHLYTQNVFAMCAVYSHHIGLNDFAEESGRGEKIFRVEQEIANTKANLKSFINLHKSLLGEPTERKDMRNHSPKGNKNVFLRILLSCLADADHTDTAAHYSVHAAYKPPLGLNPSERLEKLNAYVSGLSANTANDERAALRGEMYASCRDAEIAEAVGISSCDSPVGSGKTTAVMAHLLAQARNRGLRRVFVVLPYTNIIRQSVEVYREALTLPGEDEKEVVAELHHRADFESIDVRRFAALWRAPIIVTTAVAFFETLAANTPAALRRLHELPGSAVFVDEAHAALPAKFLPLTWSWMNIFAKEWGCYWVLASGSLSRFWQIPEIKGDFKISEVPEIANENLRKRLAVYENNRVKYVGCLLPKEIDELIEFINDKPGPRLVILNTINNAAALACAYKERFGKGAALHLSTALTPTDREKTLRRVKDRLQNSDDSDWVLVATSCVEAGVDISFRTGFRELSSLASLLQAAGRVNREGKNENAEIWTFTLADSEKLNKNPAVKDSATVLRGFLSAGMPISPELCTKAISDEINLQGRSGIYAELIGAEKIMGFETVERNFNVIESNTRLAVADPDIIADIKSGILDWRELQRHSFQINVHKLTALNIRPLVDGIYAWTLAYDDFIGCMAGILSPEKPEDYIL